MFQRNLTVLISKGSRLSSTASNAAALNNKENYYKSQHEASIHVGKPPDWDTAKPFESIPGPKTIPIFGNTLRFLPGGNFYNKSLVDLLKDLHKEHGDIVALKGIIGRDDIYCLLNPNDFENLLRNAGVWPIRQSGESFPYYRKNVRKDIFQGVGGLLTVHGEEWAKFRSAVNPILMQPKTAQQYIGIMESVANDLVDVIDTLSRRNPSRELPEDFINTLYKWALESIGVVGLDRRLGCLDLALTKDSEVQIYINTVIRMLDLMFQLDNMPSLWKYISTPNWKEYVRVLDHITNFVLKYIDEALEQIDKSEAQNPSGELSVLQKLVKIDRKIAVTMVIDMLMAGIDTTGRTMGAVLYFIARHPEKQAKLREEVMRLLPEKNTPITKEILANASYLTAVIKESNRIAPVAVGNLRTTVQDMVLAGYQIPKGTVVVCFNLHVANDEKFVPRAKEFLPERWLRESKDNEISYKNMHQFIYMPFGFGPRSCIGKRLANLELEIGLLKIIRNFELSWPHADMRFVSRLLYGIDDPLKLHVKPIEK